jgi:TPR repeat protein
VAYFAEMGIGGRRDPLEANRWYVKAAEQGDEKAIKRLAAIRAAASGNTTRDTVRPSLKNQQSNSPDGESKEKKKKWGIFKNQS